MFSLSSLGQVLFVQIDTSDETASRIMEFFNIEEENTPTSRLINLEEEMRKFVPDSDDLTAEKLRPWVQDYLDGKLKVRTVSKGGWVPATGPLHLLPPLASPQHRGDPT